MAPRTEVRCGWGRRRGAGFRYSASPAPGEKPRDEKGKHGAGAPMRRKSRQAWMARQASTPRHLWRHGRKPPGPRSGAVRQDPGHAPVTRRAILIHERGLFFPKS